MTNEKKEINKIVYEIPQEVFNECLFLAGEAPAKIASVLFLRLKAIKPKEVINENKTENKNQN